MRSPESRVKPDAESELVRDGVGVANPLGSESKQGPDAAMQPPAESLLTAVKRTLEMIAGGASLADILTNLCAAIDAQSPGIISSVLLMDPDGQQLWPAAGPRVPSDWTRAISPLMIGPDMGSCGTAAFRKERVIVSDIASDPLVPTAQLRDLALTLGLRASWSQPLLSKDNDVLGTFAMYYGAPSGPRFFPQRNPASPRYDCVDMTANIVGSSSASSPCGTNKATSSTGTERIPISKTSSAPKPGCDRTSGSCGASSTPYPRLSSSSARVALPFTRTGPCSTIRDSPWNR